MPIAKLSIYYHSLSVIICYSLPFPLLGHVTIFAQYRWWMMNVFWESLSVNSFVTLCSRTRAKHHNFNHWCYLISRWYSIELGAHYAQVFESRGQLVTKCLNLSFCCYSALSSFVSWLPSLQRQRSHMYSEILRRYSAVKNRNRLKLWCNYWFYISIFHFTVFDET